MCRQLCGNPTGYFELRRPKYHPECVQIAARLIVNVFHRGNYFGDKAGEKKTILVFVPGYSEIFELMQEISDTCPDETIRGQLVLLPLHSSVPEFATKSCNRGIARNRAGSSSGCRRTTGRS